MKEYEDCKLKIMDVLGKKSLISFPFPRNSPYIELFDSKLQKMSESGELEKIKSRYKMLEPDCKGSRGRPIGFKNAANFDTLSLLLNN